VVGVQEHVAAPEPESVADDPRQTVVDPEATAGGGDATMTVNSYLERGVDLHQYRSYTWGPADATSTGDPRLDNNRFFDERVRAQVEQQLASRGFEKAGDGKANMLVHYHASVSQEIDIRSLDGSESYCATSDCKPFIYDKGTLFLDLVDAATSRVLWRGWAEGSVDGVIPSRPPVTVIVSGSVVEAGDVSLSVAVKMTS
jgi:hypothetical protein